MQRGYILLLHWHLTAAARDCLNDRVQSISASNSLLVGPNAPLGGPSRLISVCAVCLCVSPCVCCC